MGTGARNYTRGTRNALVRFSKGTCYEPSCTTDLIEIDPDDGSPYSNFQIAHIRDANPGNRYDPDMDDDARRHFRNLVLLCNRHHQKVDKTHRDDFPIVVLEEWKLLAAEPDLSDDQAPLEDDLKDLLVNAYQLLGNGSQAIEELARLARSVTAVRQVAHQFQEAFERVKAAADSELASMPAFTAVQDGRPVTLQAELSAMSKKQYLSELRVAASAAIEAHDKAWASCEQDLAALRAVVGELPADYLDWVVRESASQRSALTEGDAEEAMTFSAELEKAIAAFAASVRGDSAPPVPVYLPPPPPPGPSQSEIAAGEVDNLWQRLQAAQGHNERRLELIEELRDIGGTACIAGPVGATSQGAIGICGYFYARYLSEMKPFEQALEACAAVEPFEYRLESVKQLWHLYEDDPPLGGRVADAGAELIAQESRGLEHGLMSIKYAEHAGKIAIWMWETWAGSDAAPRADLLRTLDGGHVCDLLEAFAHDINVGGEDRRSFYNPRFHVPPDPLSLVTDELLARIAAELPNVGAAERLPCRSEATMCECLASEYLRIVRETRNE